MGAKLEILAAVLCSVTMVLLIYQQGVESVQVGDACGSNNTKDCSVSGWNEPNLTYYTCADGGKNGTCQVPNSNGQLLTCTGTNSQGWFCKYCKAYGQSCTKDSDCCSSMDDLDRSPLPLTIKPFCHKPIVLGIRSTTGTCKPCLRDYDPCGGSNLPFCGKLNYTASSASCRDFVGLGGGYDYQGHNPNRGLIVMGAATAADPCTPEAKLANLNGFAIPTSGASDCGDYEQVTYLLDTGYERAYFCSCPDNATVGYQCRVTNLPQALLRGPTDNGQRCVKCGLNGQQCGSGNDYPCCDFHTCTSGICLPNNCTLEGERTNFDGVATNCCGGINFHRNDKDKRCTNCHCGGLGANCESGIDCCGTDTICRKVTSLTLQCEECIPDFAVNSPGRNCTSVYDCCQSLPLYEDPFAESYSFCYQQYECRPCRRENESCDQYDTCCGRLDCNFSVNNGTCLPLPE